MVVPAVPESFHLTHEDTMTDTPNMLSTLDELNDAQQMLAAACLSAQGLSMSNERNALHTLLTAVENKFSIVATMLETIRHTDTDTDPDTDPHDTRDEGSNRAYVSAVSRSIRAVGFDCCGLAYLHETLTDVAATLLRAGNEPSAKGAAHFTQAIGVDLGLIAEDILEQIRDAKPGTESEAETRLRVLIQFEARDIDDGAEAILSLINEHRSPATKRRAA